MIESILDAQQRCGDVENGLLVGDATLFDDRLEPVDLTIDIRAQSAQPEHAECIADPLEEFELGHEIRRLVHAGADKNVEHVLNPAQIFLDRRGNRLHQLDAGRRQGLARKFNLLVARQQLGEVECSTNFTDALAGSSRPCDVKKEIVQQIIDRIRIESGSAVIDEALDLPIGLAEQTLQCDGCLEPAVLQRLEDAAGYPPQLMDIVTRGRALKCRGGRSQGFEMALHVTTFDPPEQRELKLRPQAGGYRYGILATAFSRLGFCSASVRRQIQQQQRAFRQ